MFPLAIPIVCCKKFPVIITIACLFILLPTLVACQSVEPLPTETSAATATSANTDSTASLVAAASTDNAATEQPAEVAQASAPTATATAKKATPTPTVAATKISTPVPTEVLSTQTAATPKSPASTATPTVQSGSGGNLLPAPVLLEPADGMVFSDSSVDTQILLKWTPVKAALKSDELYLITIDYNHQGEVFTDYAWTQQSSWPVNEHGYLTFLSDDNLFKWSVALIRQTDVNNDGVPVGPALSQRSSKWNFVWQVAQPGGGSGGGSDDGGGGGGGYP